jgi:hypothetical protein
MKIEFASTRRADIDRAAWSRITQGFAFWRKPTLVHVKKRDDASRETH